jgi:hypothetical protein
MQLDLVELADQIVEATPARSAPEFVLHEMMSRTGNAEAVVDPERGLLPDAAEIFDSIVYHPGGRLSEQLGQSLEVVALPGAPLDRELRQGDVMVRRGEGDYAHVGVLASSKLRNVGELLSEGLRSESHSAGNYAQVVETGARPHTISDRFARELTDSAGRLLNDILLLRLVTPPTVVTVQQPSPPAAEPSIEDEAAVLTTEMETARPASIRKDLEYNCWIQRSLNQVLGTQLVVDGIIGPKSISAIRQFQQQRGLVVNGIVGLQTEGALLTAGATPPPGAVSGTSPISLTWKDILPKVRSKRKTKRSQGITKLVQDRGQPPRLVYVENAIEVIPGEGKTSIAEIEATIGTIRQVRDLLVVRAIGRAPGVNIGNYYDPVQAAKDGDEDAKSYNLWIETVLPSGVNDSKDQDWMIFKKFVELEGNVGMITTSDGWLTVGIGFSSAGSQAEAVVYRTLQKATDAVDVAHQAGLIVESTNMTVVDIDRSPTRGVVLEGIAAQNYVSTHPALLSLVVNLSQGSRLRSNNSQLSSDETNTWRQAWLDAQWTLFKNNTIGNMPSAIRAWPLVSIVLAAHARHMRSALFDWKFWENQSPELPSMVEAIWVQLTDPKNHLSPKTAVNNLLAICSGPYQTYADDIVDPARNRIRDYYQSYSDYLNTELQYLRSQLQAQWNLYQMFQQKLQQEPDPKIEQTVKQLGLAIQNLQGQIDANVREGQRLSADIGQVFLELKAKRGR